MHEEDWKHLGRTVSAAVPPLAKFGYEYDYGDPTELRLGHVAVVGELVRWPAPSRPRHAGRIVVLAQNHLQ